MLMDLPAQHWHHQGSGRIGKAESDEDEVSHLESSM